MKRKFINSITVMATLGLCAQAQSFTQPTPTPAQQQQPQYIVPGQGGNAAEAGRSSSTMQYVTAGVNGAAAVYYGSKCSPYSAWNCFFSAMAGVGAIQSLQSARGSNAAGMQLSGFDPSLYGGGIPGGTGGQGTGGVGDVGVGGVGSEGGSGGTGTTSTGGGTGLSSTIPQAVARDLAQARSALEKSGVKFSPDGRSMTTPDGRTFDLTKSANSEQDLMNLGFSPSEAAAAMADSRAVAKKLNEKFKQMSQLAMSGSGGGGGRGIAAEGGGGGDPFAGFDPYGRDRNARNRKKAQVSGLTKKLGSDTIGVAGDDIFEMVTRRYKARDEKNDFLKD